MDIQLSGVRILAIGWKRAFDSHPIITGIVTCIIAAILGFGISYLDQLDKQKRENQRLKNVSYSTQLEKLVQTEQNIKGLLEFISMQKDSLSQREDTINQLKAEHEKIKPIVEADKKVVDALFWAQQERIKASVWRERWIGFFLGIGASLIASFIWYLGILFGKKRDAEPGA